MRKRSLNFSKTVLRGLLILPAYVSYVIRMIVDYIDNKVNSITYKILEYFNLIEIEKIDLEKEKKHFT